MDGQVEIERLPEKIDGQIESEGVPQKMDGQVEIEGVPQKMEGQIESEGVQEQVVDDRIDILAELQQCLSEMIIQTCKVRLGPFKQKNVPEGGSGSLIRMCHPFTSPKLKCACVFK